MRIELAKKANEYFEKSYHRNDELTTSQIHSNSIAAFNNAINYRNNIRDNNKAIEICEFGLKFDSENYKLTNLKSELEEKILGEKYNDNPRKYIENHLLDKGWKVN